MKGNFIEFLTTYICMSIITLKLQNKNNQIFEKVTMTQEKVKKNPSTNNFLRLVLEEDKEPNAC